MLLGLASYSIYLLHSPLLALVNLLTVGWGLPTWGQYLLMTFGAVPLALAACAGFYWLVERRFKNTHQRSVTAQPDPHHPRADHRSATVGPGHARPPRRPSGRTP